MRSQQLEYYKKVAKDLGKPVEVICAAYESFWEFIKVTAEKLPLKEIDSEEEFNKLRINFNIPSLGKLCCSTKRFTIIKENIKYKQKIYERDQIKENGESCIQ